MARAKSPTIARLRAQLERCNSVRLETESELARVRHVTVELNQRILSLKSEVDEAKADIRRQLDFASGLARDLDDAKSLISSWLREYDKTEMGALAGRSRTMLARPTGGR